MKLWVRNFSFIVICLLTIGLIARRFLQRPRVPEPQFFDASALDAADWRRVVQRVDSSFATQWDAAGLIPAPTASDLALARRLSLALTGTIPSLAEIRALEGKPSAQRIQWWLSHLFEDRRFGDFLAERFARALIGVENGPFIVYRRHRMVSWLSDQIMANRPYDQMVRTMLTAEGIWTSRPEVNFVTVTVDQNDKKEGPDEKKLAGRVAKSFLGIRLDCVECHDDFMGDKWKQSDFHQLAAFFAQAEMSLTGVRDNVEKCYEYGYGRQPKSTIVPPKVPFHEDLLPAEGPLRQRLAAWVTHPENRPFARALVNRVWALLFNKPLVHPIDNIPLEGELPPALDILADDFITGGFDLQRLIRVLSATQVFQRDSRSSDAEQPATLEQEGTFAAFPLTRLRPEQMAGSILQCANLKTINAQSHVLVRMVRFFQQNDFLKRYGDAGENEFGDTSGTLPQRLVLMNGKLVHERTKEDLVMNSATRIATVTRDNKTAIETAYLAVLSRRPNPEETDYFLGQFEKRSEVKRAQHLTDLYWTLINSTEFSWNH